MQVQLVRVTTALLEQIQVLDQTCLGGLWSLEAYKREIDSPNSCLLAIVNPERVVLGFGCLWSILEEAHITILAVRPEYQRQGLGRWLLWGLLKAAYTRQLEWATLEVRASNNAAIQLYESFGFTTVGRRRNYYKATNEDALILWRKGINTLEFAKTLDNLELSIHDSLIRKSWQPQFQFEH